MQNAHKTPLCTLFTISLLFYSILTLAQIAPIGSGSYTNDFPGVDQAGRNSFPPGTPQVSGNAAGKPIPTNDWWSALLQNDHTNNLFNYPLAMRTVNTGLVVSYIVPPSTPNGSTEPMSAAQPIVVGVTGLDAGQATVSDYSDWTVTMNWQNGTHHFEVTTGIGMPFIYFTKNAGDVASVEISEGNVVVDNEMLIITNSYSDSDYAVYAPTGSTWLQNGTTYTSNLNGQNYWSMAFIPPTANNVAAVANEYKKYAYVFPSNTAVSWSYDENTAKLSSTFTVSTDIKEGTETNVLLGLLPHQWANLAPNSAQPTGYTSPSIRGDLKMLDGNVFMVEHTFKGILPNLPYLDNYNAAFDPAALTAKIALIENDALATWTDSYNEGQVMNRLIQTARIADEMGNVVARDKMVATIKERLEDWLTAELGEVAFIYYYNSTWTALIGYPAGHGQDNNLNDHHFHWGYFIHAAAFMEQFEPGWASQWGDMVNLLVRDAASDDRNDPLFPFLRNFSPYAGHSWANGFATFPFGNDQESTSESMQFASSLIHWGSITENNAIRDLGIYIYTTEQSATEEYWFDMHQRTFKPGYGYQLASRIWGNGYDNQTFWTSDIAAAYGIEMYPIHGGSLYLGHNTTYVQFLWNEISSNTGILNNEANPNLWHDTYWKYLSFIDPQTALNLYDSYPDRSLKFGISDAQTYHWLHTMNALGTVNTSITADYPIAASFTGSDGYITYVAHNYSDTDITVTFSDGFLLDVPANQMAFNQSTNAVPTISITSPADNSAFAEGEIITITAMANDTDGSIVLAEFYDGDIKIGEATSAPFNFDWIDASTGAHQITAIATDNEGAQGSSQVVNLMVNGDGQGSCSATSNEAQQGAFSIGYTSTFETVGTDVIITFTLLDTDKIGVVAYLWQQSPFMEMPMDNLSGLTFSKTLSNQTVGESISYACKFAFAGGLAVTSYINYVVGDDCPGNTNDTEAPTNFTATIGTVTGNSVEILLYATDDSGTILYDLAYDGNTSATSGMSGIQASYIITGLTPETSYTFSIEASDLAGNVAADNPIVITATTTANTSSNCSGTGSASQQGTFSTGYTYDFETNGTDVTFTFTLLDTDRADVFAYLWQETPFTETPMDNVSGLTFSKTLTGFTIGETISYACKFAFAGGLAVTSYYSYVVGDNCETTSDCIPTGTICLDADYLSGFDNTGNPIRSDVVESCQNTTVHADAAVEVVGKTAIILNAGFYVAPGSVFHARIGEGAYCEGNLQQDVSTP